MLCKIADFYAEVPEKGGIAPLLREYVTDDVRTPDIVIDPYYYKERNEGTTPEDMAYIESGYQFSVRILRVGGMMLHASAVALDGRAYLFSGPCGMGKSTHTQLWQREFSGAKIFNDDKPALRRIDGRWYAYGTPWSGKNHININMKAPLAGICFLKRGGENSIHRLSATEAVSRLIHQTMRVFRKETDLDLMLAAVESIATEIPIYELQALPNVEAAHLSHDTMRRGAEEAGL